MTFRPPPIPGWAPPWLDMTTLCACLCISDTTAEDWVRRGIIPPPRARGGKRMWRWAEVDAALADGPQQAEESIAARAQRVLQKGKR